MGSSGHILTPQVCNQFWVFDAEQVQGPAKPFSPQNRLGHGSTLVIHPTLAVLLLVNPIERIKPIYPQRGKVKISIQTLQGFE